MLKKTFYSLLAALTISLSSGCERKLSDLQPQPVCQDANIPSPVQEYTSFILNINPAAPKESDNHPSKEKMFPGGYLEEHKVGYCDEYALNTIKHLQGAEGIKQLYFIGYTVKLIDSELFKLETKNHAFVAYQTEIEWRVIDTGRDICKTATSLELVIRKGIENNVYSQGYPGYHLQDHSVYAVPIKPIPQKFLESSQEKDIFPEFEKIMKARILYLGPPEDFRL